MNAKEKFLKEELTPLLSKLPPEQKGSWGKMNAQQMVEHMSNAFCWANGKSKQSPALTPEQTQKNYEFMMTEKPFRENTPNRLLPDEPFHFKNKTMQEAIAELQKEIDDFFSAYSANSEMRIMNPFFGNLNYKEQVQLLHKHATHHAKQFGLV
jgi:hypothetical protein